jgi:hypothetical protein
MELSIWLAEPSIGLAEPSIWLVEPSIGLAEFSIGLVEFSIGLVERPWWRGEQICRFAGCVWPGHHVGPALSRSGPAGEPALRVPAEWPEDEELRNEKEPAGAPTSAVPPARDRPHRS